MKSLSKEQILAADDLRVKEVQIPEWGGVLFVRNMSGSARDAYDELVYSRDKKKSFQDMRVRLLLMTVCDEQGNLVFTAEDLPELRKKSAKPIARLFDAALELNGMGEDDVKDMQKNSDGDLSADSTSS